VTLAARIRAREPLLGPLIRMPNETLLELTGYVGMDFAVVDTEHGPGDQLPLTAHLAAADAVSLPVLVRVGQLGEILRVLDLGAAGVIIPHVSSAEQAEAAVRAAHYPPRGDRGFATYSRSARQGLTTAAQHLAAARAGTAVIAMIEDGPGVAAASDIAAVDGVDALFVGPADLSTALGHPGEPGHPDVIAAMEQVRRAAEAAGIGVVGIVSDPAAAREKFAQSCTMVIYNTLAALGQLFTDLATGRPAPPMVSGGERLPLVVLPGMLGTPEVWDPVADILIESGVSVQGCRIDVDDSIGGMAASVLAQAPQRFDLAGHSLGGIVALEIVRQAPERVRRLILANTSGRGASPEQLTAWQVLKDGLDAGRFGEIVAEQAVVNLGPAAGRKALVDAWVRMAHRVGPDGFRRQLLAQSTRPDSIAGLRSFRVPTLVITGELDLISPAHLQQQLAESIPGARYETVSGSGHMSPVDAVSEVAELIRAFVS
jgi:4-hydroxy-2-oxoheptanedioate aldolase